MKIVEPIRTKKYEEHLALFGESDYFNNLTATSTTFWGAVRTLRAHPASIKLFLDSFVESCASSGDLREELKRRFFMQNERTHDAIASRIYFDSSVLDLGAGIGCLKDMLDLHGKVVDYHAQDISERLLGLNPAADEKKYCCDFRDLYDLVGCERFDFVVDCNATHNLSYKHSEHEMLLRKLTKLGRTYIYYGATKLKIDKKQFRNIVVI
jgi:SAM-dependent methyltransferase